jgi:hypothetical protein
MKGVILRINPNAAIVDITHGIEPQDLIQTAYTIRYAYRFFPDESVHLIVVDPGVGSDRDILAVRGGSHCFIAPNNGVLTLLLEETAVEEIVRVENSNYFLQPVSRTFHGRDIFAPAGAHLSRGIPMADLGPAFEPDRIVRLQIPAPRVDPQGRITGTVIAVDRFGNLVTNIDRGVIRKHLPGAQPQELTFQLGSRTVKGLASSYSSGSRDMPVVVTGSMGYLEIALYRGSAQKALGLEPGDPVAVSVT